jgi:hypothetical protein
MALVIASASVPITLTITLVGLRIMGILGDETGPAFDFSLLLAPLVFAVSFKLLYQTPMPPPDRHWTGGPPEA